MKNPTDLRDELAEKAERQYEVSPARAYDLRYPTIAESFKSGFDAGHTEGRREALEMAEGLVDALKLVEKETIEMGIHGLTIYVQQALAKFEAWRGGK